jgi:hypothetical protein
VVIARNARAVSDVKGGLHGVADGQVASGAAAGTARGLPLAFGPASMLSIQRTAGNRAARSLVESSPVSVQRKTPSMSGLLKAVGVGKRPGAAAQAEQAGAKAKSAKVLTVTDLKEQVSTLDSATKKLVKAHQPGDTASQRAAFELHRAADHILGNLPDQNSKASKVLGRTYPEEARRLQRIIDDTQLILDEVRVANTRRQAQDIYHQAGRNDTRGQAGALTKLTATARYGFDTPNLTRPAAKPEVAAYLQEHGFSTYEEAFEAALAKKDADPGSEDMKNLSGLQPELFQYAQNARPRSVAASMGISPAELAAIQTYTAQDYLYINPATQNDPAWLRANYPDLVDKPNKTTEDWQQLRDQLAASGQTLDQRTTDRQKELKALREEGALHTGVALQGLLKMPVWKGTAYRGEAIDGNRFDPRFVKDSKGFRPRQPTFTWKTITSISKSEKRAGSFMYSGSGFYQILWEFEIIDGRDIEGLSVKREEREVALLPGAEFAYGAIKVTKVGKQSEDFPVPWQLRIKAKQIK